MFFVICWPSDNTHPLIQTRRPSVQVVEMSPVDPVGHQYLNLAH